MLHDKEYCRRGVCNEASSKGAELERGLSWAHSGTGIGAATPSPAVAPNVAATPGAGLTCTPSNVLSKTRGAPAPAVSSYNPTYSSFTPASTGNGALAPR
jgi:hypothetical protein